MGPRLRRLRAAPEPERGGEDGAGSPPVPAPQAWHTAFSLSGMEGELTLSWFYSLGVLLIEFIALSRVHPRCLQLGRETASQFHHLHYPGRLFILLVRQVEPRLFLAFHAKEWLADCWPLRPVICRFIVGFCLRLPPWCKMEGSRHA